ncbi:hypothetical protein K439DRAFT_1658436 [Ramaria rubella]|nr:hypothetical protein K439DRAFT_1658436 [Ramaria rubella]
MSSHDHLAPPQRRIRHITSLQIRNLTPFPARDALAQTLIQANPSSSSLPPQAAEDIELTVASRRRRRISASSVVTVLHLDSEEDGGFNTTPRRRTRSGSKGSFQSVRNAIFASGTPTIRPRGRTNSKASSVQVPTTSAFHENVDPDPSTEEDMAPVSGQFVTHSQRALEKIVSSRLVETFVTLTLQPSTTSHPPSQASSPPTSPAISIVNARKGKDVSVKRATSASAANHRRGASNSSTSSTLSTGSSHPNRTQSLASPSSPSPSRARVGGSARISAPSTRPANFPSPPPTPPPSSPRPKPTPAISNSRAPPAKLRHHENSQKEIPFSIPTPLYISPTHLPSTNPTFSHLDPEREFAPWADTSASRVKVAIWGRGEGELSRFSRRASEGRKDVKGKSKEQLSDETGSRVEDRCRWTILDEWIVDLDDMEPVPLDLVAHRLPSNTLLLTLSSGQVFRIPPVSSFTAPSAPSRAPSPLGPEYNSDGEVENLKRRRTEHAARERETLEKSLRETRMTKSATFQDLVKIVNLHTCIVDTQELLEEVLRNCDALLESDGCDASLRQASELEEWINTLRAERNQVLHGSAQAKDDIQARRKALEMRRNTLASARAIHETDNSERTTQFKEVTSQRNRHSTLVASLSPLRTALIQAVSFIFPIEPISAPDLLFAILGAPLPIPASATNPAPPLSLPSHPDVTEDAIATSLGYVAQVIQLVSAYLGKGLVYPVTCCGSRSVIKDPISAMMGPRMFPLYSKGVETYRFEYGVFLLNKNIEMLMADRNLRAMDMRHTLPNLKNLLLTLTTGEEIKPMRRLAIPLSTGLPIGISPTRNISPLALDMQSEAVAPQTTPQTIMNTLARKPTPFLSPLAAMLRARYPSSAGHPSVKVVDEIPEPAPEDEVNAETPAGQAVDHVEENVLEQAEPKPTVKADANGISHTLSSINGDASPFEKLTNANEPPTPPPLQSLT